MAKFSTNAIRSVFCVFVLSFLVVAQENFSYDRNSLTFKWYENVKAEKVVERDYYDRTKHLAQLTEVYDEINGTYFLQGTNFPSVYSESVAWRPSGGFVDTMFYSYQNHHNVIIRPDDVWTAIVTQFSLYVNANSEAFRHSFVNFEGKKQLEVKFYTAVHLVPIDQFIRNIVSLIDENIDPTVSHWIKPNFSTTTVSDELTVGVALMATLQNYFDYKLLTILCGIPEVTILGNVNDWMNIRQRVDKLTEFELNGQDTMAKWSKMLGRILDEIIKVKDGKDKDSEFWKQAIRVDYKTLDLGCALVNETYLNGWITTFTAFDRKGKWQADKKLSTDESPWLRIKTDKITPGVVTVPIKIYDEFAAPHERNYMGAMITGHMGYAVKTDEKTLQPMSGWGMTITNKAPDYLPLNR